MSFILRVIVWLSLCLGPLLAWAQPTWTVRALLDSNRLLIGDQVSLRLMAQGKGEELDFPAQAKALLEAEGWEVLEVSDILRTQLPSEQERQELQQVFILTAWEQGRKNIPALAFALPNGDSLRTSNLTVQVEFPPLPTGDSTALADIKPIMETSATWQDYLFWALLPLGLLLLGLLAWGLYRWFKSRVKTPPLSPEAWALQALQELESKQLIDKGKVVDYHAAISYILRDYLNRRFPQVKALESPLQEFLPRLPQNYLALTTKLRLQEVLETADLVKFAKASPLAAAHREAWDLAQSLIKQVQKKMEEEAAAAKQASKSKV